MLTDLEIIAYLYGIYLLLLSFDHYGDFSTMQAQSIERAASRRLNNLMVVTFRRRSSSGANLDDAFEIESQDDDEYDNSTDTNFRTFKGFKSKNTTQLGQELDLESLDMAMPTRRVNSLVRAY